MQHPELELPARKELHFFDLNYALGWNWYQKHFPDTESRQKYTGEASPYYLFHPLAPGRISMHLPNVKLVVLLRNPADRAYSHFMHQKKIKNEPLESFEEALELEDARITEDANKLMQGQIGTSLAHRIYSYTSRGFYYKQISLWLSYFPKEQMHFIKSEDFFCRPEIELTALYQFLGISQILPGNCLPQNKGNYSTTIANNTRIRLNTLFHKDHESLVNLLGEKFRWY